MMIKSILQSLLNLIYPPRCPLCDTFVKKDGSLCSDCDSSIQLLDGEAHLPHLERRYFDRCISSFAYEGRLREALHGFKYSARLDLARFLGDAMATRLDGVKGFDMVVPVPMHPTRLRKRGFNPAALLAKRVGETAGIPVETSVLECRRELPSQVGLERDERMKNVKGAFDVDSGIAGKLVDKNICLVDDTLTTGATVCECSRALRRAGAKSVLVLTAARTL